MYLPWVVRLLTFLTSTLACPWQSTLHASPLLTHRRGEPRSLRFLWLMRGSPITLHQSQNSTLHASPPPSPPFFFLVVASAAGAPLPPPSQGASQEKEREGRGRNNTPTTPSRPRGPGGPGGGAGLVGIKLRGTRDLVLTRGRRMSLKALAQILD